MSNGQTIQETVRTLHGKVFNAARKLGRDSLKVSAQGLGCMGMPEASAAPSLPGAPDPASLGEPIFADDIASPGGATGSRYPEDNMKQVNR